MSNLRDQLLRDAAARTQATEQAQRNAYATQLANQRRAAAQAEQQPEGVVGTIGNAIGNVGEWIADAWTDDFSATPIVGAPASAIASTYQEAVDGIAMLGSAGLLAAQPKYWENRTPGQDIFTQARQISPGQALLTTSTTDPNFNITSQPQRDAMFKNGGEGQFWSGAADTVWMFFMDPLVLMGKATKVFRFGTQAMGLEVLGRTNMKVAGPKATKLIETMADDELDAIAKGETVSRTALGSEAERIVAADFVDAQRLDIFQGSNRDLLAGIGAQITDKREAIIFAAAASGSDKYAGLLKQEFATAYLAFRRAWGSEYETRILNVPVGTFAPDLLDDLLETDVKAIDVLKDMRKRSPEYARMSSLERAEMALDDPRVGQYGLVENFGSRSKRMKDMHYAWQDGKVRRKSMVKRQMRDASIKPRAGTMPALQETVFQISSHMPRVKVWEWAGGEHGNGYIDIAGYNDGKAADGLVAALSDSKILRRDQAWIREQVNRFGMATTQQERWDAVIKIEWAATKRLAQQYGIKDLKEVRRVFNDITKNREETINRFRSQAFAADEAGNIIDTGPVLASQLQYTVPMLDMAAMEKSVKILAKPFYNMNAAERTRAGMYRTKAAYDEVLSLWKASVLLRLGYTIRNTGEGWLRTAAFLGSIPAFKYTGSGIKNSAYNNYRRLIGRAPNIGVKAQDQAQAKAIAALLEGQDNLAVARMERDELLKLDPLADTMAHDKKIAEFEAKLNALGDEIDRLQRVSANLKSRRFAGDKGAFGVKTFKGKNGQYVIDNTRTADLLRAASSAQRTKEVFLESSVREGYRRKMSENAWGKVEPGKPQYWQELATAGRQIREDEVAVRLLNGESPGDLVAWIQSEAGRGYRRRLKLASGAAADRVAFLDDMVTRYFPTDEARALLASKVPTDMELQRVLGNLEWSPKPKRKDFPTKAEHQAALQEWNDLKAAKAGTPSLSPIHGRQLASALDGDKSNYQMIVSDNIDRLFNLLGSYPESTLVRHPFYAEVWDRRMQELIAIAESQGKKVTEDLLEKMNRSAHRTALRTTNETLFTIERYSNAAAAFRWFAPFFAAWENSAKVWTRLVVNDPSILARASILWNIPARLGMVVDNEGNTTDPEFFDFVGTSDKYIILPKPMSDAIGKLMGGAEVKIPLGSLNVVTPGETPYLPGMGPTVAIPVGMFLAGKPDWQKSAREFLGDGLYNQVAPFGQPATLSSLMPAWMRKEYQRWRGEGDAAYLATAAAMMQTAMTDWYASGGDPEDMPDMEEVLQKTNDFYRWSAIFSLTLPFTTTRTSKYQPQIDYWRNLLKDDNISYDQKVSTFIQKWGDDMMPLTVSTSRYSAQGISPDQENYEVLAQNEGLARQLASYNPEMVGILASAAPVGEFDEGVYTWLQNNGAAPGSVYRERMTPDEVQKKIIMADAWRDFRRVKTKRDDELARRAAAGGSASLSASANADIAQQWSQFTNDIMVKEYGQTWITEYRSYMDTTPQALVAIDTVLNNETFMTSKFGGSPLWAFVAEYVDTRNAALAAIARGEDSALVRDQFAAWAADFKDSSLEFSDFYDRFLDNDNLQDYGVGNLNG